jgi:putative SOS response-associated peptidase YedK
MSFAALGQVPPSLGLDKRDALVIITVDSDLGMVAIHDRRPVVLSLEHARE